jgi:hypothetical protein
MTRTTESGKVTIAEANVLEHQPMMPHLTADVDEMNARSPSMVAPDDVDTEDEANAEGWDQLYQDGLKIAELIWQRAAEVGRKRHTPERESVDK